MKKKANIIISFMLSLALLVGLFPAMPVHAASGYSGAPKNLSVPPLAFDESKVVLTWEKPDDYYESAVKIVDYEVFRDETSLGLASVNFKGNYSYVNAYMDAFYEKLDKAHHKVSILSFTATGLEPKKTYEFKVRAVYADMTTSAFSVPLSFSTAAAPIVINAADKGATYINSTSGDNADYKIRGANNKPAVIKKIEDNTAAIQAAIDATPPGGKMVLKGSGDNAAPWYYTSGSLFLHSNMTFEIEKGAVLLGSPVFDHYPRSLLVYPYSQDIRTYGLLNAVTSDIGSLENIRIVGKGAVDGNGWKNVTTGSGLQTKTPVDPSPGFIDPTGNAWRLPGYQSGSNSTVDGKSASYSSGIGILAADAMWQSREDQTPNAADSQFYNTRPNLTVARGVNGLYYEGLTFYNPAFHGIVNYQSEQITANGIVAMTFDTNNGDGIEFGDCLDLRVMNSFWDTGDDVINFAAGQGTSVRNLTNKVASGEGRVFNNFVRNGHGGLLAMGSHTGGWIGDLVAEENVYNSSETGSNGVLRMKSGATTGGGIRNIVVRDNAVNYSSAGNRTIVIDTSYTDGNASTAFGPESEQPLTFENVLVRNMTVSNSTVPLINNKTTYGSSTYAKSPVLRNFTFEDIKILSSTGTGGDISIEGMSDVTFRNITGLRNAITISNSKNVTIKNSGGTPDRMPDLLNWSGALNATAATNNVNLNWPAVDNATQYAVLVDMLDGHGYQEKEIVMSTGSGSESTVIALRPSTSYKVAIRPETTGTNASYGKLLETLVTTDDATLGASTVSNASPDFKVKAANITGISWQDFTWNAVTDAVYGVHYYEITATPKDLKYATQTYKAYFDNPGRKGYSLWGLDDGVTYDVTMKAINWIGQEGPVTAPVTITTVPGTLMQIPTWAPTSKLNISGGTKIGEDIILTWDENDVTDYSNRNTAIFAGYRIMVNGVPVEGGAVQADATATVQPGTHTYVLSTAGFLPNIPYTISVEAGDKILKYASGAGGLSGSTSFNGTKNTNLPRNQVTFGKWTGHGPSVTLTFPEPDLSLVPPAVIQAAPGFNSVTLAWERVAGAQAYDIYKADSAGGPYVLAEADVKSTIFEVHFSNGEKLKGNQTYYFKIKAKNSGMASDFSQEVSQKTDAFNPADGWAATGAGTTGGDLGTEYVIVTTYADLKAKIGARTDATNTLAKSPYLTIYVKGLLKGSGDITLQNVNNVSIVGLGNDAVIDGYGFVFKASNNIIVRNITMRNALSTKAVDIQSSKNIYFEHNDFSNAKDGLTDIKSASDLVTMAWNRYSKHEKTMLIGSGWSATSSDRGKLSVTIHHNWFEGTQERHPRVRFGKVHVYNNYYSDIINYAAASTSEAQVLLEGNYFKNVPIVAMYSRSPLDKGLNNLLSNDPLGLMKVTDTNKIVGTGGLYDQLLDATYEDAVNVPNKGQSYSWSFYPDRITDYTYTLDNADQAKADIEKLAGVEKKPVFTIPTLETPSNIKNTFKAGGIDLEWNRVQGATQYVVKYATSAAGPFTEMSTNVPSITLPVGSVELGATYYAAVTAFSDKAVSIECNLETMKAAIPAVPSKPTLQRLDKSFKVAWNEVPNAGSYTLTITNKITNDVRAIRNITASSYLDSNLDAGTTYSYAVEAVNYFGSSAKSVASEDQATTAIVVAGVNWIVNDNFDAVTEDTPIGDYGYVESVTGTPGSSVGVNFVKFLSGDVDGSNKGSMSLFLKDSNGNFATVVTKDLTKGTTKSPFLGKFVFDIDFKEAPPENSKPIRLLDSDGKVAVSLSVDSQSGNLYYSVKNESGETNTNHLLVLGHNVWYNVRIAVDMDAKLVDVYINGQLYLAGAPLYDPTAKDITSFRGETSNGGIKPIQYRNVKAGTPGTDPGGGEPGNDLDVIFYDDFTGATSSTLFTSGYRSLPGKATSPMYIKTGGNVTAEGGLLSLVTGGRMAIGALGPAATTPTSTPGGAFDLSKPYQIIIKVSSGTDAGLFQVYVDNNTTSAANSVHGSKSKVYEAKPSTIAGTTFIIPIAGENVIGTSSSFIQLRTDSSATIVIDSIKIVPLEVDKDPADVTALSAAIVDANKLLTDHPEGNAAGQAPKDARDALGSAIAQADAIVLDAANQSQVQVDAAVGSLRAAISTFKAAVVPAGSADPADVTALSAAIVDANKLLTDHPEGNAAGQAPKDARDALGSAIAQADAIVLDAANQSQDQVDAAVGALRVAISTFKAAVVGPDNGGEDPGTGAGAGAGTGIGTGIGTGTDPVTHKAETNNATGVTNVTVNQALNNVLANLPANNNGKKRYNIDLGAQTTGSKKVEITIPTDIFKSSGNANAEIAFQMSGITVGIPGNMLTDAQLGNAHQVSLQTNQVASSELPADLRATIGDRPVFNIDLSIDGKSIGWSNDKASVTVSIAYNATAAELANDQFIIAWYIDGNGKATPMTSSKYDPVTKLLTFTTNHFSHYAVAYDHKTFADLGSFAWAKNEIEVLSARGIINGTSATTYAPSNNITRADFTLLLVRALGLNAEFKSNFPDVKSKDYYHNSVGIAKELGIITGDEKGSFNPNENVSRQDMFVIAARALRALDQLKAAGALSQLDSYADKSLISNYATVDLAALVQKGLVKGDAQNKLNPLASSTRAEAGVFIYRLFYLK